MRINVAIADDQKLFRKGMIALVNSFENMKIIFEAENGKQLVDFIDSEQEKPNIILLDLSMPEMNGLEALKIIKENHPEIGIVILTIHEAEHHILATIQAGANGYLAKNAEPEEVEKAIREVFKSDFYFTVPMLEIMRKGLTKKPQAVNLNQEDSLTPREKEVLQLICKQFSSIEIAEKLFLSNRTVEGHRNNLLAKTGSRNTAGLVLYALKHKLIEIDHLSN
ncbi:response regulator transcription factor [Pedobacter xixiisoli]|uniref:Two component transcriptional regulator, LuxR family n=1 Tax=Pedobacter xixiisoli TaxID=1476464 RepID=A0A285ZR99_9SPHI|nr:response regulator transcription factor [Pedobacter xixiisoli]SOD12174.1 two component transcriptional regulator, LuxR family [Pedobacter xixiisoli]